VSELRESVIDAAPAPHRAAAVAGIAIASLLGMATLGEGGASVIGVWAWHTALLLLAVVAYMMPTRGGLRLGRLVHGPTGAFVVFAVIAVVGGLRAANAYSAWLTCLELLAFTAVALLASSTGTGWTVSGIWILRLVAASQAILMIVQRLAGGTSRPAGTFLNTNHAGAWLVALLLLSVAASFGEHRTYRHLAWAMALPSVVAVVLTGSRGALIGIVVGAVWLFRDHGPRLNRRQWMAIAAVVLAGGAVIGWRQVGRVGRDPFIFHRVHIWKASVELAAQDPVWGSGPGQFAAAAAGAQFDDGDGALRFDRGFHTTHSDLLRPASEFGIPATIALLAAIALTIREIRRRRRQATWSAFDNGATAALLALSAQAAVDNPSTWPAVYLLAAALLGHLLRAPDDAAGTRSVGRFAVRAAVAAAVVAIFIATEVRPTLGHFAVASLPRGRLTTDERASLERAISRNPLHPDYRMRLAEQMIEGRLDIESYARAREEAEAAVRLDPSDGRYLTRLAGVERIACGRLFQDVECRRRVLARFAEAARLRPTDASIQLDAAGFALASGAPGQARELAERAMALEPNSVPARLLLAQAMLDAGPAEASDALRLIEEGARIAADHAGERDKSGYSAVMLGFDAERAERLVRRAREISADSGS